MALSTEEAFRCIQDLSSALESRCQQSGSMADLFHHDRRLALSRVNKHISQFYLDWPNVCEQRAAILDLYWRKCVYAAVSAARALSPSREGEDKKKCLAYFLSAVRLFHDVLSVISSQCGQMSGRVADVHDFRPSEHSSVKLNFLTSSSVHESIFNSGFEPINCFISRDDESMSIEKQSKHMRDNFHLAFRCFIALGDICRYLIEFQCDVNEVFEQGRRYYASAMRLNWTDGLAMNQIASLAAQPTLAGGIGEQVNLRNKVDAWFFYAKSIICTGRPFAGTKANMSRFLNANATCDFAAIARAMGIGKFSINEVSDVTAYAVSASLEMVRCVQSALDNQAGQTDDIRQLCQLSLFFMQHSIQNGEHPLSITGNDISTSSKVSLAILFLIEHASTSTGREAAAIVAVLSAYVVAFTSYAVNRMADDIDATLRNAVRAYEEITTEDDTRIEQKRSILKHCRTRYRRHSFSADSDRSQDSVTTSQEESDDSEFDTDGDDESEEEDRQNDSENCGLQTSKLRAAIITSVDTHPLSDAVYICLLWIRFNDSLYGQLTSPVSKEDEESSELFFRRLRRLFTLTNADSIDARRTGLECVASPDNNRNNSCESGQGSSSSPFTASDESQRNAKVVNDTATTVANGVTTAIKAAAVVNGEPVWSDLVAQLERVRVECASVASGSKYDMGTLTDSHATDLLHLIQGSTLESRLECELKAATGVRINHFHHLSELYTSGEGKVALKKVDAPPVDDDKTDPMSWFCTAVEQVDEQAGGRSSSRQMRSMAKLWLAHEVRQLEDKVEKKRRHPRRQWNRHGTSKDEASNIRDTNSDSVADMAPAVVVDELCLIHDLNLIKMYVRAQKFVIVVPLSAIQALDESKTTSFDARHAIRWLERKFEQGNPWITAESQSTEDMRKKEDAAEISTLSLPAKVNLAAAKAQLAGTANCRKSVKQLARIRDALQCALILLHAHSTSGKENLADKIFVLTAAGFFTGRVGGRRLHCRGRRANRSVSRSSDSDSASVTVQDIVAEWRAAVASVGLTMEAIDVFHRSVKPFLFVDQTDDAMQPKPSTAPPSKRDRRRRKAPPTVKSGRQRCRSLSASDVGDIDGDKSTRKSVTATRYSTMREQKKKQQVDNGG